MPTKTKTNHKESPKTSASALGYSTDSFKVWQEIYAESNRFMTERWQQALDAQAAILTSGSPNEAMQIHAEYLQAAFKQYAKESAYLINLAFEAANLPSISPGMNGKRKYNDVPL